jgi:hypothetical protein
VRWYDIGGKYDGGSMGAAQPAKSMPGPAPRL